MPQNVHSPAQKRSREKTSSVRVPDCWTELMNCSSPLNQLAWRLMRGCRDSVKRKTNDGRPRMRLKTTSKLKSPSIVTPATPGHVSPPPSSRSAQFISSTTTSCLSMNGATQNPRSFSLTTEASAAGSRIATPPNSFYKSRRSSTAKPRTSAPRVMAFSNASIAPSLMSTALWASIPALGTGP